MNLRKNFDVFVPLLISLAISVPLGLTVWTAFFWIGPWVGGSMSLGSAISKKKGPEALDFGRRLSLLLLIPLFIVFFGFMQRENFQIEETVFYSAYFLATGIFTRCLIHFAVAKVIGPFIWGRGFCGWVCWIAAGVAADKRKQACPETSDLYPDPGSHHFPGHSLSLDIRRL